MSGRKRRSPRSSRPSSRPKTVTLQPDPPPQVDDAPSSSAPDYTNDDPSSRDPLSVIPPELFVAMLGGLGLRDRAAVSAVSRPWRRLSTATRLWRSVSRVSVDDKEVATNGGPGLESFAWDGAGLGSVLGSFLLFLEARGVRVGCLILYSVGFRAKGVTADDLHTLAKALTHTQLRTLLLQDMAFDADDVIMSDFSPLQNIIRDQKQLRTLGIGAFSFHTQSPWRNWVAELFIYSVVPASALGSLPHLRLLLVWAAFGSNTAYLELVQYQRALGGSLDALWLKASAHSEYHALMGMDQSIPKHSPALDHSIIVHRDEPFSWMRWEAAGFDAAAALQDATLAELQEEWHI